MRLPTLHTSARGTFALAIITLPYLTSSAPANVTSPTNRPILAVSPIALAADVCPTPPTQFLPYPPPPGYVPNPGCPPASSGTQPSEGNPPAGFYGGSGSGSGSSSQSTSSALSLKSANPVARIMGRLFHYRRARKALVLHSVGRRISAYEMHDMEWMFGGIWALGRATDNHRV